MVPNVCPDLSDPNIYMVAYQSAATMVEGTSTTSGATSHVPREPELDAASPYEPPAKRTKADVPGSAKQSSTRQAPSHRTGRAVGAGPQAACNTAFVNIRDHVTARFGVLSDFLRAGLQHYVTLPGKAGVPQLGTGIAGSQWEALGSGSPDGSRRHKMLQQHIVKLICDLRTAFPDRVRLGRVGNRHTGNGPSITHYHVWGANASNWQAWNDKTGDLQRTCAGSGQAAGLRNNKPVPGWFGIVTTPVNGYGRPQLKHPSGDVTNVAEETSGAPSSNVPQFPLTHPDFKADHWYDALVATKCQRQRLALAYSVVGIDPDGLVGDKAKIVRIQYLRQSTQVHPDKKNFADSKARMTLLVKAYELVQEELQPRKV